MCCVCACVAVYLNLHNLCLVNPPARKSKYFSCLLYTNSLKVSAWREGRSPSTSTPATSRLARCGWSSTTWRASLKNKWIQARVPKGGQCRERNSDVTSRPMEETPQHHVWSGVAKKQKQKTKPDQASCCASPFTRNTGDRRSLGNDSMGMSSVSPHCGERCRINDLLSSP